MTTEVTPPSSVIVVGAGLGGWRTAAELRGKGFRGSITLVGAESTLPYDRPPLSKVMLSADHDGSLPVLADVQNAPALGIDLCLGVAAQAVQPGEVGLETGRILKADAVVAATGSRPRWPTRLAGAEHLYPLRTHDDALRVRALLSEARSLLVLGGGFIGGEVASAAADRGLEVTVVEAQDELFAHALGNDVGRALRERHEARGVRVVSGRWVVAVHGGPAVSALLDDGTLLAADGAVGGFGATLNTECLIGLQLDVTEGLVCDVRGRVDGVDGLWAVGDVAAWYDPVLGRPARREHWSTAAAQATVVASDLFGVHDPVGLDVPYFWSDQAGTKLQVVGWPELADEGTWATEDTYEYRRGGELVAAAVIGAPRALARYRKQLSETAPTPELTRGTSR